MTRAEEPVVVHGIPGQPVDQNLESLSVASLTFCMIAELLVDVSFVVEHSRYRCQIETNEGRQLVQPRLANLAGFVQEIIDRAPASLEYFVLIIGVRQTHRNVVADEVSYTHLRAHETRHDLVCRLLL